MQGQPLAAGAIIGREGDAGFCFPTQAALSLQHFRVAYEHGLWWIEDLGSRNGTLIEGSDTPVTRCVLRDGDLIHAGDVCFLFVNLDRE